MTYQTKVYLAEGGDKLLLAPGAALTLLRIDLDADFDNTPQSTGVVLPDKTVVLEVWLEVTSPDAGETLSVGAADPAGFLEAAPVGTPGLVKGSLASGGQTRGALLRADASGAGGLVPEVDVSSGGQTVTYTGSATLNTMRGSIYLLYLEIGG